MDSPSCENLWSIIGVRRSQARLLSSPPKQKRRHIRVSLAPPIAKPTFTVDKWQVIFSELDPKPNLSTSTLAIDIQMKWIQANAEGAVLVGFNPTISLNVGGSRISA